MSNIYQEIILEHYRHPRNVVAQSELEEHPVVANPLCGDSMRVFVEHDGSTITSIQYAAEGCAISIATASILSEHLKGKSLESVKSMNAAEIQEILGISLGPTRLKCALLPLEAIKRAIFLEKHDTLE